MRLLQVSRILTADCGVSLFAEKLETHLRAAGIHVDTTDRPMPSDRHDLVLLQHHEELYSDDEVRSLAAASHVPVVLFAHSECDPARYEPVDGFIAMNPRMLTSTEKPVHTFAHPAWTPRRLDDRAALRREFDLPPDRLVLGTHGYLRFERQFVEIIEALLPEIQRTGWLIELITSPWRLDSPGLLSQLQDLRDRTPDHFCLHHEHLDGVTLNRRLQSCDLLWCWTNAPSSPYASGVISDQYASGTRVIAPDKEQHRHVLGLPNTVAAPDTLAPFLGRVIEELRAGPGPRHDPSPVSWDNFIGGLAAFLRDIADGHGHH
jgi:hypothetical protein